MNYTSNILQPSAGLASDMIRDDPLRLISMPSSGTWPFSGPTDAGTKP